MWLISIITREHFITHSKKPNYFKISDTLKHWESIRYMEDDKECVIEFQAFRNNDNTFIIKELVVLNLTTGIVSYFIFKPPFPLRSLFSKQYRTNKWLTSFFHHISWEEGFVDYKELEKIIIHNCRKFKTIYTSGVEKTRFIQNFTSSSVISCNMVKYNDFNNRTSCCSVKHEKHIVSKNCALYKAYCLASFLYREKK